MKKLQSAAITFPVEPCPAIMENASTFRPSDKSFFSALKSIAMQPHPLPLVLGLLALAAMAPRPALADSFSDQFKPKTHPPLPTTTTANQPAGAPAGGGTVDGKWKLVWSDEFDGSALDTSKWQFEINGKGGGNGEMQYYTDRPANLSVAGGHMTITAAKEAYQGPDGKKEYTSARIISKGKGDWKYGRFEARIKMPKGKGLWPAFWMMPSDSTYGGWAKSGEIDIAEVIGDKPNIVHGTLHYGDSWPKNIHTGDKFTLPSGDFSDDFHVFAIEWKEGSITWSIDGKPYQTQTKWSSVAAPFPAPFNQRFYYIFNVAVGGNWPGPPNAGTVFPQKMEVDYVRAYEPVGK